MGELERGYAVSLESAAAAASEDASLARQWAAEAMGATEVASAFLLDAQSQVGQRDARLWAMDVRFDELGEALVSEELARKEAVRRLEGQLGLLGSPSTPRSAGVPAERGRPRDQRQLGHFPMGVARLEGRS